MEGKRICGNCNNFVPEGETMIERARAKYPWPHCKLTQDEIKPETAPACLVWMPKKITGEEVLWTISKR